MRKQPKGRFKCGKIVKNFRNFLFENDELLKKILLNKRFLKLIKEYAIIFSEFFETFFKFGDFVLHVHFFYYFQQVIYYQLRQARVLSFYFTKSMFLFTIDDRIFE